MIIIAIAAVIFTFIQDAQADFKLTHGETYNINLPDVAHSYDGVARDISKFYKPSNTQFYIGGQWTNRKRDTSILFTYDNGFNSDKLDIQPSLRLGINHVKEIEKNTFITLSGSRKFGGDTKHTSCVDSLGGEFYCGNLTHWSDFKDKDSKDGETYDVGIRLTYLF